MKDCIRLLLIVFLFSIKSMAQKPGDLGMPHGVFRNL